ncbi:AfsA-related hotdog domain-containing protein [Streptomyces sp. NPDC021093]|uniref:AfsA-related hotdog domain-containing protein n=1 Tax=Streptomyces sp. NPDC021093 TaxID=3365112 RepID=UPI0037A3EBA5
MEILYLVGDRFASLAANEGVMTAGGFLAELRTGRYSAPECRLVLLNGQGMGVYEWAHISRQIALLDAADRISVPDQLPTPAQRGEAHKHREENVLVAGVRQVDSLHYRADLRLHDNNELLLDHTTGQHVQGMVIIEACRQMFLAVTERFYASAWPQRRYYYVIKSFDTQFENFLFPLDAVIDYEITGSHTEDPGKLAFSTDIRVSQAGRQAALCRVEFTAFEHQLIAEKEGRRASRTVRELLASSTAEPRSLAGVGR